MKTSSLAVVGGVGFGRLTAIALRAVAPGSRSRVLSSSLVPVALVYPLARTAVRDRPAVLREVGGVAAMAAVTALGTRSDRATRVIAWGWLAHAAFDVVHDPGRDSRLPDWYPALCAGFDAGVAWDLLARP